MTSFTANECPLAGGLYHSLVIDTESRTKHGEYRYSVHSFGSNRNRMLGLGEKHDCDKDGKLLHLFSAPKNIPLFEGKHVFAVGCGDSHSVFLQKRGDQEGGSVWVVGLGSSGRLGVDRPESKEDYQLLLESSGYAKEEMAALLSKSDALTDSSRAQWHLPVPVRLTDVENIVHISCGADHTLALTEPGVIWAWGLGSFGNLGTGTTENMSRPAPVHIPEDSPCSMVAAGTKHSMALTREGGLMYSWGHGGNGRLGQGDRREASLVPGRVLVEVHTPVCWIAAGEAHSAAVDALGNVFCWGAGARGRTGHGEEIDYPVPKQVRSLGGTPCTEVALGALHSIALAQSGGVHTWGSGYATGQLGAGGSEPVQPVPQELTHGIFKGIRVRHVAAGSFHSLALLSGGKVVTWGNGSQGRLGQGAVEFKDQVTPKAISLVGRGDGGLAHDTEVATGQSQEQQQIRCGGMHSALVKGGELWLWGSNEFGQLGFGDKKDRPLAARVLIKEIALSKATIDTVTLGLEHCIALTTASGTGARLLFSWGRNQSGQLGLGNNADEKKPRQIGSIVNGKKVAAGEDHSAAILVSGELYTWGSAQHGKLGHGSSLGSQNYPRQLRLSDQVDRVSCGAQHTGILNMQGQLFTFGSGWFGRLGHGDLSNQATPKRVEAFVDENEGPAPKVFDIHCGSYHSFIVTADRVLWCCGRDSAVCEVAHVQRPVRFGRVSSNFPEGTKVKALSMGANHTLCLSESGTLWVWGENLKGQLGLGPGGSTKALVCPMALDLSRWAPKSEIADIAAGYAHSMISLESGAVYAWGCATGGRLGILIKAAHGAEAEKVAWEPLQVQPEWSDQKEELSDQGEDELEALSPAGNGAGAGAGAGAESLLESPDKEKLEAAGARPELQAAATATAGVEPAGPEVGDELDTLAELQRKLHREPPDQKVHALRKKEADLGEKLDKNFQKICRLWDKPAAATGEVTEWQLEDLRERLDLSLCRNLRRLNLSEEYPNLDDLYTHHRVCQVLVHYEELLWVLQQQPCYLARLSQIKIARHETNEVTARLPELLPRAVGQIFREVGDSRTRHLFVALICRVLALEIPRREVEGKAASQQAKIDFGQILDCRNSKVYSFMAILVRHPYFKELHRSFFDADNEESLLMKVSYWTLRRRDAMGAEMDGIFALEVSDLHEFEKVGDEALMSEKERAEQLSHMRARLQEHQKVFHQFLGLGAQAGSKTFVSFIEQLQLHPELRVVLVRAVESLRRCLPPAERMPESQQGQGTQVGVLERKVYEPVLRLLMTAVFANLLENHESIMSGQMLSEAFKKRVRTNLEEYLREKGESPEEHEIDEALPAALKRMRFNLSQLGKFLMLAAKKDFKPGQTGLQTFANSLSNHMLPFAKRQADGGQDDLGTKLVVDLYTSHYDTREHFVMLKTTELLHLSNALWLHSGEVVQGERRQEDKLLRLLNHIQPPATHEASRLWPAEVLAHSEAHQVMHNFTLSHRFLRLYRAEGLCFCHDCGAPLPRSLAREDQRSTAGGLELLQLYQDVGAAEELLILGSVIASKDLNVDLRNSKNFMSMQYKLEEAQKALNQKVKMLQGSKSSDGYSLLTEIEKGKKALNHLRNQGATLQTFIDYLADALASRERHYKYLLALEEELAGIDRHRTEYVDHLRSRLDGLSRFVIASENVAVPSLLRNKASDNGVRLRLTEVERLRLREEKRDKEFGEREGPEMLYSSATFTLFNLLAKKVVRRMGGDLPMKEHRNIFFTFNCRENGNWEVVASHKDRGKSHMLCTFEVTVQEVDRMKRAGKCEKREFNDGFVVMSCFNLLQLLARVRATNIKG